MDNIKDMQSINTRVLNIDKQTLSFEYKKEDALQKVIELPLGYEAVTSKFFKSSMPTEAETEYAINFIEDHLMSNKEFINHQEILVSQSKSLADVLSKNGLLQGEHSRKTIEDLFNNYARIVMGTPSTLIDIEITKEDFAALLVLREVLHHLNFESIDII